MTPLISLLLLAGAHFGLAEFCLAQVPDPPAAPPAAEYQNDGPIHTLHVYMDLIQVPVLVLDSDLGSMRAVAPDKFRVSLDSGPDFRPRSVRREGDDPIALSILLDTEAEPDVMLTMSAALAKLVPGSLQPHDRVTLHVLDCGLTRTLYDAPADAALLREGADRALEHWMAHRKDKQPAPCEKPAGLWDSMVFAINQLSASPGRRVMFVASNGVDKGSKANWNDLVRYAQHSGVAVFGYTPSQPVPAAGLYHGSFTRVPVATGEDPFRTICELSGGMVMRSDGAYVAKHLARFVSTVRGRYILEFARPRTDEAGRHNMLVTIPKVSVLAYVRPAGVSVVLPDAAISEDPDTIPRDTTDAPELGKRKILKPD